MSYSRLRGKIREVFGTQGEFADAMDMNASTLSKKLNDRNDWSRDEMRLACMLLEIPLADMHLYFFTPKIEETQL